MRVELSCATDDPTAHPSEELDMLMSSRTAKLPGCDGSVITFQADPVQ